MIKKYGFGTLVLFGLGVYNLHLADKFSNPEGILVAMLFFGLSFAWYKIRG